MAHQYFTFLDTQDDQVAKLHQMEADYPHLPEKEQKIIYGFLVSMLENTTEYAKETYRQAVYCFQHLHKQGLLTERQKRSVFRLLYKLCDTELFKKRLNYSIAVSKTLRDFCSTEAFPKGDIQKCYDYLMANMGPIRGFNAYMCQRCWYTTFKQLIHLLGISVTEEVENSVYAITNLNAFHKQLKDSYNKQLNDKMNAFYELYFKDVESIRVHDIKSADKATKIEDKKKQKQGVDKTILLKNGKRILIEEKFREPRYWENRKTDILLEYISIDNKNIPGWVYTSKSDFLVVLYKNKNINDSELYVFPFKPIRQWVKLHHDEFMACRDIVAPNTNWKTISKEVPLEMIMRMIEKEEDKYKKLYKIQ